MFIFILKVKSGRQTSSFLLLILFWQRWHKVSEKRNCLVCLEIRETSETSMNTSMLLGNFIFVQRTWHPKASCNSFMSSRINKAGRTMDLHPVPSNHLNLLPPPLAPASTCILHLHSWESDSRRWDCFRAAQVLTGWPALPVAWPLPVASQNWDFHSVRSTNLCHIPLFSFWFKRTTMFL